MPSLLSIAVVLFGNAKQERLLMGCDVRSLQLDRENFIRILLFTILLRRNLFPYRVFGNV